jgi:hypothetical protein
MCFVIIQPYRVLLRIRQICPLYELRHDEFEALFSRRAYLPTFKFRPWWHHSCVYITVALILMGCNQGSAQISGFFASTRLYLHQVLIKTMYPENNDDHWTASQLELMKSVY